MDALVFLIYRVLRQGMAVCLAAIPQSASTQSIPANIRSSDAQLIPSQVTWLEVFPRYHCKRSVRRNVHALLAVPPLPLPVLPPLPVPATAAPI